MFVNLPVRKISWLTFGAIVSIFLGYISFKFLPEVVVKVIQKRIKLDPSSPVYELWRDAPVNIYHRFYFFNITNPIEIERGAPAKVKEIGPFVYKIKIKKVPVIDNNNDTVSYRELKQWLFDPELSAYNEDYVVTTINSPLISALNFIQRAPQPLRTWISITLDTITEGIFIRRSIKQLTFHGYPDILVSIGTLIDPRTPNTDGRFAYLAQKNNSVEAEYTIYNGKKDANKLGLIENVDGRDYISKWKDYPCRDLSDVYTGQVMYSPMESSRTSLQMFVDLFGRKLNLKYRGTVESYPGIKTYRYGFDENNFKNAADYPPNACYTSRLPKAMYDAQSNASNSNNPAVERQSSPGSLLLNLARRRFENGASPLANLFNRNLLNRPIVGLGGLSQTTTAQPTTTTTTTGSPEVMSDDEAQPASDDYDVNSSRNNPAESLIMTTETNRLNRPIHSNAHSNEYLQPIITTTRLPTTPYIRARYPDESNVPSDANIFDRTTASNAESRQDQFGSLGSLFSNRVRESPLLSLFVPRDQTNSSPAENSRFNGRLFNRNGNNVLGNLISNGLNRLLNLRNARRLDESTSNNESNSVNNELNRTVLARSVRNALRRVTRNTGPISSNSTLGRYSYQPMGRTTPEEYIKLRKQNMFPSGAFDFSEIAFGAPILLSQPHFLNADSYYSDRLIGMKPDAAKHDFFIDVEPITGSSIRTAIRIQINVALLKSPNIFRFRNFKENIFPVFWQEIDMELPDNFQSMLRLVGGAPNAVSEIVLCICAIIGMGLFTWAVFVFAQARAKKMTETIDFIHRPSITIETVGVLNGRSRDNKFTANTISNMALSTNVTNDHNLSAFDKHKSKDTINDFSDQSQLHRNEREHLHGIDNPIPVLP